VRPRISLALAAGLALVIAGAVVVLHGKGGAQGAHHAAQRTAAKVTAAAPVHKASPTHGIHKRAKPKSTAARARRGHARRPTAKKKTNVAPPAPPVSPTASVSSGTGSASNAQPASAGAGGGLAPSGSVNATGVSTNGSVSNPSVTGSPESSTGTSHLTHSGSGNHRQGTGAPPGTGTVSGGG
jgi:hypothetical protein